MTQTRPDLPKGAHKRGGKGGPNVTHKLKFINDPDRKARFVEQLAINFRIREACEAIGICYATYGNAKAKDPEFADAVEDARERYKELIEKTIHDRAIVGWEDPVFFQGEQVGTVRKYSDRLLLEKAKRHIPEYQSKTKVEQTVTHSGTIGLEHLTKEDRHELRGILERRASTNPSEN